MRLTRRTLLAGLAAQACAHRARPLASEPTPEPTPDVTVRLGWRWAPGEARTWRLTTLHETARWTFRRVEAWRYVARDLDASGVLHLRADLVGLGVDVQHDGTPVDDPRIDAALHAARDTGHDAVDVRLQLTGAVVGCTAEGFADALPHRLLGVDLPTHALSPGDVWNDRGLLRALGGVAPLDADLRPSAETTLQGVRAGEHGWDVDLVHTARLQAHGVGPAVEIAGRSVWCTDPGTLRSRVVTATWRPTRMGDDAPGRLTLQLTADDDA